jgi:hypothetical protein
MLLPPLPGKDQPNWQAEIKIESLVEDVAQLYIEVDARWANPVPWDHDTIIERVKITHEFINTRIVDFLQGLGHQDKPF